MGGRETDNEMGAYCQHLLRGWLTVDPRRTEKEFCRLSGISPASANKIKNQGIGVGNKALLGFAKVFGVSVSRLYADGDAWRRGVAPGQPPGPRLEELPAWAPIAERVRRSSAGKRLSPDAWANAASTSARLAPRTLDDLLVLQIVSFWHGALTPSDEADGEPSEGNPPASEHTSPPSDPAEKRAS